MCFPCGHILQGFHFLSILISSGPEPKLKFLSVCTRNVEVCKGQIIFNPELHWWQAWRKSKIWKRSHYITASQRCIEEQALWSIWRWWLADNSKHLWKLGQKLAKGLQAFEFDSQSSCALVCFTKSSWRNQNIQEILCNGGDGREHPCCTQRYWAENLVCWFLFTYKSQYFPHNIFSYRCIRNPADQLWKYVERYELRNHLDLSIVIPFKRSSGQWIKITTKTGRHGCKPCDSLSCYCVWQSSTSFTIKSKS